MFSALMLRATSDVLDKAKDALSIKGCTPLQLSSELGIAVQLVENFLNGEIVDRSTYNLVCESLNIHLPNSQENAAEKPEIPKHNGSAISSAIGNHQAISIDEVLPTLNTSSIEANQSLAKDLPTKPLINPINPINIEQYLPIFRQNISEALIRQCDRLKVIDVNSPLYLHDVFVEPNVFTDLPSSQYLDLTEAFGNVSPEQYDRFYLAKLRPNSASANQILEKHERILLVGHLGSGKTTLLKYWSLACITDKVLSDYLPIFLPLRSLFIFENIYGGNNYQNNPLAWLESQIVNYGLPDELLDGLLNNNLLEELLKQGRFLLLWDGLDEIPEIYRTTIAQQILTFSDRYPKNRMVLATRNPVYGHILESFQPFEIAPFKDAQIIEFANKWFQKISGSNSKKQEKFLQLLTTNKPLAEIVSNPLFLTYVCNIFNSCEYLKPNFYQEILNLLLSKWEQTKCLQNISPQANSELSISQKQDLLSYVALVALDRHGYLWQNNELEDDFQACINASKSLAPLKSQLTSDREQIFQILKWRHSLLIECAKGVYCLTHTTLHDYLAAYRIANSNPAAAQKYLLERIYLKRWHGVIVMTVSISQTADRMLQVMKRNIDELLIQDPHLQSFLVWVNQQSIQIKTPYKAVTIRALYLDIDLENTRSLDRARALDIAHSRSLERARAKAMGIDNNMETEVDIDYTINLALNLDLALYFADHRVLELASALEPDLHKGLQFLLQKFPDPRKDREKFAKWWQAKGLDWSKKLRALIVQHRKGSQEWQFSENQLKVLRTYNDANRLLIECLNNAEYVSPLVKSQIESTLLLPQSEYSILQY